MSPKRFITFIIIALIFLPFVSTGCGKKQINLEYRIPKGDDSIYKIHSESSVNTVATENNFNLKTTTDAEISQKVTDVDKDGSLTMDVSYNTMKVVMERDGKAQELPTEAMLGKTFEMKMSKKGKLLEFEGEDVSLGENMKNFSQMNASFPDRPVKIGESWETHESTDIIPSLSPDGSTKMVQKVDNKYTLQSLEKVNGIECAKIVIAAAITQRTEKGDKPATQSQIKVDGTGDGKVDGVFYFAANKGKVVKADMDISMKNTMSFQKGDKSQTTTTEVKVKMNMELVQKKAK